MASKIDPKDPYAVKLSVEQKRDLCRWLCDEIEAASDARTDIISRGGLIDYAWHLYEQGPTPREYRRFKGAADLTSWIPTEKVDALESRIIKAIWAEPFSIVEGWGPDAQKAPFVEEFHNWKRRDERLRQYLTRGVKNSLVEGTGVLEVIDHADVRLVTSKKQARPRLAEDGTVLLNDKGMPEPEQDERGALVPPDQDGASIEVAVQERKAIRVGPRYRVVSLRDFLFLPGHATDKSELFGYAKRVWMRVGQIKELQEAGIYDEEAVKAIGETSERTEVSEGLERSGQHLAEQRDETAEKELWSVLFLKDCDGDGMQEWYIATVSVKNRELLRIRRDDMRGLPRFITLTPFPRTDSVYGYSLVLDKLATISEEHTAQRNMVADRSNMATNPPLKRRQGALWDPEEQPWGTGQVMDVREHTEVEPMVVPDVPASAFNLIGMTMQAAERLTGLNDNASAINPEEKRTATEVQTVAIAGAVRTEEAVENIQEDLQLLDEIRHEIWFRVLSQMPEGIEAPESVTRAIQTRGLELTDGRFTAQSLQGNFRFKPHGSVQTADKGRMRADYNGFIQAMAQLGQMLPPVGMMLQHPEVVKSIVEQALRLYDVPDKQPYIDALRAAGEQMAMQAQMQQQAAMGPGGDDPLALLPPQIQQLLAGEAQGGVQ